MRVALILGGAASVEQDANDALQLGQFQAAIGCNKVGIYWRGSLDAWVSLHPDKFKLWAERRRRLGLPPHRQQFGIPTTQHRFPNQTEPGSSGLFALKVALMDMGFDKAVLCGVPISPCSAHFDDPKQWVAASEYRAGWRQAMPHISDRTRSMGGWTADLLGRPTEEWLHV